MKYKFEDIAINSTAKKLPEPSDNEHYIGLEHLDSSNLYVTRWGAETAPIGEKLLMKKGDVLFGKRRAYQKKVGIAPFDGIFSAHGMVLRPKEDVICKSFFPFFISSDYFLNEAIRISVGGLSPTINWKDLRVLEFELPSLEEQRVLADKLWAAYEVKESYKNLLAQTDKLLHAQFQKMFGDPNVYGNGIPFEDAFEIMDNLRKPLNEGVRSDMHDGAIYPYYGATGQVDTINQYMIDITALCLAEDCGDFTAGGESAYIISGKSWVNNHAHILVPKKNCEIKYAWMLFKLMDLEKYVDNENRKKLTQTNMKKIRLLIPSIDLQHEFVRIAEQAEQTNASLNKGIEAIEAVIRSLIAEGTTRV